MNTTSANSLLSLARERVKRRLDRALAYPIVIICAPLGFGKSTVLREFLAEGEREYRSVVLSEAHSDMLAFMRALATSVGDLAPALLTSFMSVYGRLGAAKDAPAQIAAWAVEQLLSLELIVAVDGLEHVVDARVIEAIGQIIESSAGRIRWIAAMRSTVGFPIARWLADERMDLPIDDADLALTVDDLCDALAAAGMRVARSTVHALHAQAAGLPAIVALGLSDRAALCVSVCTDIDGSSYDDHAVRAYAARTAAERRFLRETCLYRDFDARMLAIAGWNDVLPLLERLRADAAFLYLSADGGYRYHEIFRDFLVRRLRLQDDAAYQCTAAATAEVFRVVGRWANALELFTGLGAVHAIGSLVSERGFELIDRGEADVVANALRVLADPDYTAFPVALAVKASLESLHGSFDIAEAWFRHAMKISDGSAESGTIGFRFATDLVRRDRRDAIDVLEPIVASGEHELALGLSLAGLLAVAYATQHLVQEAGAALEGVLERIDDVEDAAIRAKVYYQAGYVALFADDPVRAKTFALRALETALSSHLHDIAARALSILYNVAMDHEDDVAATRVYLAQLAACSIKAGSRYLRMYATLGLYEIEVLCGNLSESERLDEELRALEVDYSVIATETLLPAQALRATWSGDFHRAYRLVSGTADQQITAQRQAQRYAEIAVYAAAAGLQSEAASAIARALERLPSHANDKSVAFSKLYIVLALTLLGRHARSRYLLQRIARSQRLGARLEHLLTAIRAVIGRWTSGRYRADLRLALDGLDASGLGGVARLLKALPLPETRAQFGQLTSTERDVLVHISAGLEPTEIAKRCGDPLQVVDAHILSVCRKLGCTSIRHAVALATSANMRDVSGVPS